MNVPVEMELERIARRASAEGYQPGPIVVVEVKSVIPTVRYGDVWRDAG